MGTPIRPVSLDPVEDDFDTLKRQLKIEREKVAALSARNSLDILAEDVDTLAFGVIGDIHVGSLYHDAGALQAYYDLIEEREIESVFCAGDVLDGHKIYRGQEFELREVGFERQLNKFVESVPEVPGVTTYFITGNHDGSFKALGGFPVGLAIQSARPDWQFLGEDQAQIKFETDYHPFSIRLLHPGGGSAYAISYKSQKIVDQMAGGNKPNVLAIGHFHKAELMPSYRNVCVLQTGAFQRQTPFMTRRGLAAHVGGWIVEVDVGETHNRIRAEFVAFY
jgi:DNA polymerase II small subunit/DNA polymerase delta subunit B